MFNAQFPILLAFHQLTVKLWYIQDSQEIINHIVSLKKK